ncbi:hypothetical protein Pla110_28010 [Polystyrenella longa]|uniref:Uncharacterized protein n=1 Tax=Polystyrenella longa TaxID=2528007 RepID=A0A518CPD5_9PLAN|nr:TMEM43 family protein [Polystyrenella longa]QDU81064.1 hypothetical protein Pla110_28010 [Polystyrenella longa]
MSLSKNNQDQLTTYPASAIVEGLKLLFVGLVFALFAGAILWVNEWNNLTRIKSQLQNETAVVELNPAEKLDATFEGRVIHLTGSLKTKDVLIEDWLNLEITGLRLFRRVQIFEESTQEPRSYRPGSWIDQTAVTVPSVTDSIPSQTVTTFGWYAEGVQLGDHHLGRTLLERLTRFEPVLLADRFDISLLQPRSNISSQTNDTLDSDDSARWYSINNEIIWGNPNRAFRTGDLRVQFYYVPDDQTVSLIARQGTDGILVPFITRDGEVIERLQVGKASWQELYPEGKAPINWLVWAFRLTGALLMWAGCWFLILPGTRMLEQLDIRNLQFEFEPVRMSALAAVLLSLLVMSAAWIYYQPVWGTILIVGVLFSIVAAGWYFWRKLRVVKRIGQQS